VPWKKGGGVEGNRGKKRRRAVDRRLVQYSTQE